MRSQQIPESVGCVFKLFWGEKYVIVKGKTFLGAMYCINKALEQFKEKNKRFWAKDNLYYHFIDHIIQNPEHSYKTELILSTDNPYQLLKAEQKALDESVKDKNCLNNSFDAYVPMFKDEINAHGWVNNGYYLNFMKWKKNRKIKIKQTL